MDITVKKVSPCTISCGSSSSCAHESSDNGMGKTVKKSSQCTISCGTSLSCAHESSDNEMGNSKEIVNVPFHVAPP
jgi:hypothetical protein